MSTFKPVQLGRSELQVSPICLGTMTFGEQVDEAIAHAILERAVEGGINFIDTAEMYSVPTRAETYGATERIIGNWFAANPAMRKRVVLATKVAGPARNMDWVRNGSLDLSPADIVKACDDSLQRLRTDVIDLYQIHWPNRNAPTFGAVYFDPAKEREQTPILEQLQALDGLVKAGKVRAIGLSNETPWGVCEFVHLAERHGLARIATVQNPYALTNRSVDNGLDEVLFRHQVSLLAYSPLAFGALTGKYDDVGIADDDNKPGRLAIFDSMKQSRWTRPEALAAAREYNALAKRHGITPTQLALGYCAQSWRVASTIIGVTTVQQLYENISSFGTKLSDELLGEIDAIRKQYRDPAQ
ncbi:aldo/keto reductase [Piscinibacter sakaiensis]|uniref:aldo/keto reductase n=1 Tax=Piscinibacter sakaiensis TaxID=1547922 RepID=UPI003AAE63D4